jgi:CelD/BcsL family acetyltransferase involved in cellulose biosynthesis
MVAWKNDQLARTGQPRTWATPWVRAALDACFDLRAPQFGGALFTMHAEDRLAAAAFCLRSEGVLHLWLLGHDSAFDACSPGVQLVRWIVGWAGDNGVAEVDFGVGDYQYKRQLSTTQRMLERGVIAGATWSGAMRRAEHAVRARIERLPHAHFAALPGKAMRRMDLMRALG